MKVDGACACGAIRIEAEADPEKTQICHCTDCQTATGTAFRISLPVSGATVKISGKPATYVKTTRRERPAAGAGVLRKLRNAGLFDLTGGRRLTADRPVGLFLEPLSPCL